MNRWCRGSALRDSGSFLLPDFLNALHLHHRWCHACAEEGLLAEQVNLSTLCNSPALTSKLLANLCLGCWQLGHGIKAGLFQASWGAGGLPSAGSLSVALQRS